MDMYIPPEDLSGYARSTAARLRAAGRISGRRAAAPAVRAMAALEAEAKRRAVPETGSRTEADRWLLDNLYLARQAAYEVREAFRVVPRLRAAGGRSLIGELCSVIVRSGEGEADRERIALFLDAFQDVCVLTAQELGLVRAALAAAELELLADLYRSGDGDGSRCAVLFTGLRRLERMDLSEVTESADRVERLYQADPAGVYPRMDRASRGEYRRRTALLARREGVSEYEAAQRIMDLASRGAAERTRHVGFYL